MEANMVEFNNLKELLIFNIKYYRYKKNLSQEKVAELSGLTPRYLTDVERGIHCPTILKIEKIASALDIKPYELFMNPNRDKNILKRMNEQRQYNQNKKN